MLLITPSSWMLIIYGQVSQNGLKDESHWWARENVQESCFDVLMHVKIFLIDDPENFHSREPHGWLTYLWLFVLMFFTFVSIVCSDYLLKLPLVLKMDKQSNLWLRWMSKSDPGVEDLNVFRFLNRVECLLLCVLCHLVPRSCWRSLVILCMDSKTTCD